MPETGTGSTICFICTVLQGLAAAVYLAITLLPWWTERRKNGDAMPFIIKRPFIPIGLIVGALVSSGIGFWLVFHPPQPATASTNSSGGWTVAQPPKAAPQDAPPPRHTKKPKNPVAALPSKESAPSSRPTPASKAPSPLPASSTPTVPGTTPQPTYTQQCEGSACAQGPNSTATYNQYGAPKLVITDQQRDAIRDAMKPYAGLRFEIARSSPTQDSDVYADQLKKALVDAELVLVDDVRMIDFQTLPNGPYFYVNESGEKASIALWDAMKAQGLVKNDIARQATNNTKYDFMVKVSPNR